MIRGYVAFWRGVEVVNPEVKANPEGKVNPEGKE
jgi:hypothetical protein